MSDPAGAESRARERFVALVGGTPEIVIRSPGRVNVIGDHTDYSEGFVLPIAIDRAVWLALRPRDDGVARVWAELVDSWSEFDVNDPADRTGWSAYLQGVAHVLGEQGHPLRGFDGVLTTDLPAGAGLSSSAALELAAARAFAELTGSVWDPVAMALACQRAEQEWVGMNCGIMDQLVCAAGRTGSALLIDCRSLETRPTPMPHDAAVIVLDTVTRRELVDSAYNERRRACEAAATAYGVAALRDLDAGRLEAGRHLVDEVTYRRARHVVNENAVTVEAAEALAQGDLGRAGELMDASHASLAGDYEVSTPALDAMAAAARTAPGCFGARMTGAGFGGSVVALVARRKVDAFVPATLAAYEEATGTGGTAIRVTASAGVGVVP